MTIGGRLAAWLLLSGILAAVSYAARAASGKPPEDALYRYGTAIGGFVQYAVILAILLGIAWGLPFRETFALRRPRSWRRSLLLAAGVLAGIWALGAILNPFLHPGREQGLTPEGWDPSRAGAFALNAALLAVVAPVVEELGFRGLGFSLLARYSVALSITRLKEETQELHVRVRGYGEFIPVVVTALVFALVHGLVNGLPILVAFGVGLAYLRSRAGSVAPPILLHMLFNGLALVVAVTA